MTADCIVKALQASGAGVWEWDIESGVQRWSEAVWCSLDLDPDTVEPSFAGWITSMDSVDKRRIGNSLQAKASAGLAIDDWWRVRTLDGSTRAVKVVGRPVADDGTRPRRYAGIVSETSAGPRVDVGNAQETNSGSGAVDSDVDEVRKLNMHIIDIREDERRRIARDIHDDLGQRLTAINLGLHWVLTADPQGSESVRSKIGALIKMNSEVIDSVQRIASRLRPKILDDMGLEAALGWLIADLGRHGGPTFTLEYEIGETMISPAIALTLFRIAQESVSNILKHAKAANAVLTVSTKNGALVFSVADDGVGFDVAAKRLGTTMGLLSMRERVRHTGGAFSMKAEVGAGTTVEITIPYAPQAKDK